MEHRRIITGEEQDAYTGWRRVLPWHSGERARVKRRTHKRERREGRGLLVIDPDWSQDEITAAIDRYFEQPDCRHGCNGDCQESGSEVCGFTCHDDLTLTLRRAMHYPDFREAWLRMQDEVRQDRE